MTADSKLAIMKKAYEAFNAREIEPVLELMRPNVDWPNGMEGGRVHGREGVREYWTRQWGMLNPRVDPIGFEDAQGGRTAVHVHQVVRDLAGQVLVDQIVNHVYCIRDGLIERVDIRTPNVAASPALQKRADGRGSGIPRQGFLPLSGRRWVAVGANLRDEGGR